MVPARRRLKVPGQGVHICAMPLCQKTTLQSGNNIGVMVGVFKQKNCCMPKQSCPILHSNFIFLLIESDILSN